MVVNFSFKNHEVIRIYLNQNGYIYMLIYIFFYLIYLNRTKRCGRMILSDHSVQYLNSYQIIEWWRRADPLRLLLGCRDGVVPGWRGLKGTHPFHLLSFSLVTSIL